MLTEFPGGEKDPSKTQPRVMMRNSRRCKEIVKSKKSNKFPPPIVVQLKRSSEPFRLRDVKEKFPVYLPPLPLSSLNIPFCFRESPACNYPF